MGRRGKVRRGGEDLYERVDRVCVVSDLDLGEDWCAVLMAEEKIERKRTLRDRGRARVSGGLALLLRAAHAAGFTGPRPETLVIGALALRACCVPPAVGGMPDHLGALALAG